MRSKGIFALVLIISVLMTGCKEAPAHSFGINSVGSHGSIPVAAALFFALLAIFFLFGITRNMTERRTADERARLMLEATPLCCSLISADGRVLDCNQHAVDLYGMSGKQEYLEKFYTLMPERQPDGMLSREAARIKIGMAFESGRLVCEWMHQMPNGTLMPSEVTLVRVMRGNQYILAGYTRDLREHKKMIGEIERKDHLLQITNDMAFILLQSEVEEFEHNLLQCMGMMAEAVDVDRISIWKNHTVDKKLYSSRLYLWTKEKGSKLDSNFIHEASYDDMIPGWEKTLLSGQCINGLVRRLSPAEQATLVPLDIMSILVVPVFLRDKLWGFAGFDDCRHERAFSEDEVTMLRSGGIMIASALLRNEMTMDIREAVETAQEANRAKSTFLSNMSHEIRTPLNAIMGMATIGKAAADLEKKDYALEKIDEASRHLLGIVNDILDMSKIEANKFELDDVEFKFEKMLQRVFSVVNFRIIEKKQRFDVSVDGNIPQNLIGDNLRLSQVVTNLLSNALKFTPERGTISLGAHLIEELDGVCTIQIDVADTGIGIDPSRQQSVFESFEQAENRITRKYGGTGLGLSISRHIVETMGGRIWVESEPGKGSKFSFTVKMRRGAPNGAHDAEDNENRQLDNEKEQSEDGVFSDKRMLLAEDVEINREIIISILISTGIDIVCADNGRDAVDMFEREPERYDIILMDIQMPETDGLEATRRIRSLGFPRAAEIPILAMTANVFREDIEKCVEAGMNDHLGKPLDIDEVFTKLNRFLLSGR